jgi:hypothetical protein
VGDAADVKDPERAVEMVTAGHIVRSLPKPWPWMKSAGTAVSITINITISAFDRCLQSPDRSCSRMSPRRADAKGTEDVAAPRTTRHRGRGRVDGGGDDTFVDMTAGVATTTEPR